MVHRPQHMHAVLVRLLLFGVEKNRAPTQDADKPDPNFYLGVQVELTIPESPSQENRLPLSFVCNSPAKNQCSTPQAQGSTKKVPIRQELGANKQAARPALGKHIPELDREWTGSY